MITNNSNKMAFCPLKEDELDEDFQMFENFENKAIEHFCAQMLMAITPQMFQIISQITPDVVESHFEMNKAVKMINQFFIDDFMPDDPLPDNHMFGNDPNNTVIEDPTRMLIDGVIAMLQSMARR